MKTTFEELTHWCPCSFGKNLLLKNLGRSSGDVYFIEILESNGILDASWCLRVLPKYNLDVMKFKLLCARTVQHLLRSDMAKSCLDTSDKFINGEIGTDTIYKHWDSIRDISIPYISYSSYYAAAASYEASSPYSSSAYNVCRFSIRAAQEEYLDVKDIADQQIKIFKEIFCKDD